ncbi:hypothetical protein KTQ42_00340|uniref:hypothetical protein n=1 Tax=Noviherbaspirillum sp. L7-7A TaxID=2850560 RepID=UPI001C2C8235|nr:hypothetical protein [Noviherbaspirillum sp. L7-7A]MBV0877752.1 hypothetical protein [Noviherbaspirillum sp. L7-7A]
MHKAAAIAVLPFFLAACGGSSSNNGDSSNASGSGARAGAGGNAITLSGLVSDGPIAGAQVCLFSDGVLVKNAAGAALCSSDTDAEGNYTIAIPNDLAPGFLTLVASKGSNIKLASALGTLAQVMEAAGGGTTVTASSLPSARISHFTTADFVLADINNDGTVSKAEIDAYVPDYTKIRPAAVVVKAVIDFGQAGSLLGSQASNTLLLASAAVRGQTLGTTSKTATQWVNDAANASVVSAVDQDLANAMAANFASYQFSTKVTSFHVPSAVSFNNGSSIFCEINTSNESVIVDIAVDASRGIFVLRHDGIQTVGSYNPKTGAVSLTEPDPLAVSMMTSQVTYYAEGYFKLNGTLDISAGKFTGNYAELSANTWSLDATRQECTAAGSVTATRL